MGSKAEDKAYGCAGIIAIVLLVAFFAVSFAGGCGSNYSDGVRAGQLRKFSRKGIAWKSWEGELLLSNGYIRTSDGRGGPDVWTFSVTDPDVAKRLESVNPDARISLEYRQWFIKPISQDSRYTVVQVK